MPKFDLSKARAVIESVKKRQHAKLQKIASKEGISIVDAKRVVGIMKELKGAIPRTELYKLAVEKVKKVKDFIYLF